MPPRSASHEFSVLVVNAGRDMAERITAQLTQALPFSNILYAPSLELARWLLARRPIHLVIADAVLPDGHITELRDALGRSPEQPTVIVVGEMTLTAAAKLRGTGYRLASCQTLREHLPEPQHPLEEEGSNEPETQPVADLGAAIRNDLNNPLQEIVALVFVAKAAAATDDRHRQALDAINRAAKGMASVIGGLEDRIRGVVSQR